MLSAGLKEHINYIMWKRCTDKFRLLTLYTSIVLVYYIDNFRLGYIYCVIISSSFFILTEMLPNKALQ